MPVRNEDWILARTLAAASTWADAIIVADQGSTDSTREICDQFPKVHLVHNRGCGLDEASRQTLLLSTARSLWGQGAVLVALDADEMLAADVPQAPEWQAFLRAGPGAHARIPHVNIDPSMRRGWRPPFEPVTAFIDDGRPHVGTQIHSTRFPVSTGDQQHVLADCRVIHYQYADPDRLASKHRWYQCWERINSPERTTAAIYRQYHHMDVVPRAWRIALQDEWFRAYEAAGIHVRKTLKSSHYWWDEEVRLLVLHRGPALFARLDIWRKRKQWDPDDTVRFRPALSDRVAVQSYKVAQPVLMHPAVAERIRRLMRHRSA